MFGHCFLIKFFEGYASMIEIEFQQLHFMFAVRTFQRIIAEGRKNSSTSLAKAAVYRMFASGYGTVEFGINLTVPCIQPAIANHFKMIFRDMSDQTFDEIQGRNGFFEL